MKFMCPQAEGRAEMPWRKETYPADIMRVPGSGVCAGLIRAEGEASGEALVRGSNGGRTCSGGARPRERLRGPPGTGEVHSIGRATPEITRHRSQQSPHAPHPRA